MKNYRIYIFVAIIFLGSAWHLKNKIETRFTYADSYKAATVVVSAMAPQGAEGPTATPWSRVASWRYATDISSALTGQFPPGTRITRVSLRDGIAEVQILGAASSVRR